MTVRQIVDAVREIYLRDADEELFPGADEAELQRLKRDVLSRYGVQLPEGLLDLLRQVNGFGHDGHSIYATRPMYYDPKSEWPSKDGIVEANEGMEVDGVALPNAVCIGEGGDDFFGIDWATNQLVMFDLYGKPLRQFSSFEEMFLFMFENRI